MKRFLQRVAGVLGLLLLLVVAGTLVSTSGGATFGGTLGGERLERAKRSPRYANGRFVNEVPVTVMQPGSSWGAAVAWVTGTELRTPNCPLPLFGDTKAALGKAPATGLRLTWLGHSTVLIEIDGHRVLTDPQFSYRASPSTWVGPSRFHPVPLELDQVPELDAIVISHDHYDHLDMGSVKRLEPKTKRFLVGLGVGAHLETWGIPKEKIVELEWWQQESLATGLAIVSTPAQHFSGRLVQSDPTLWSSWTLIGPEHRVFVSGDTGPGVHFEAIGKRYAPLDVALLEVGQYNERWGAIHLGPAGALVAHKQLGARKLLPYHWGTFMLGYHDWSGPAEEVFTAAPAQGIELLTPKLGEPVEPDKAPAPNPWWRALPPTAAKCP